MLNWLLHEEPLSPEDEIALSVLDHLLMGTPPAPPRPHHHHSHTSPGRPLSHQPWAPSHPHKRHARRAGTPTSTLYKPMIESGLGAAIMGGGVSDELKQATFSIGLKGVKPDDVPKVEELATSTLAQAVADGFEDDAIEASLNTIEFSLREFNTVRTTWMHGPPTRRPPISSHQPLARIPVVRVASPRGFRSCSASCRAGCTAAGTLPTPCASRSRSPT